MGITQIGAGVATGPYCVAALCGLASAFAVATLPVLRHFSGIVRRWRPSPEAEPKARESPTGIHVRFVAGLRTGRLPGLFTRSHVVSLHLPGRAARSSACAPFRLVCPAITFCFPLAFQPLPGVWLQVNDVPRPRVCKAESGASGLWIARITGIESSGIA